MCREVFNNPELALLSSQLYWKDLCDDIALQGGASGKFTGLIWPLGAEDPDDAFSSVPYEKGFNLLNYLEGIVSTPVFMAFAKHYIQKYKFSTVTSGEFKDTFVDYVKEVSPSVHSAVVGLNWDELFLSTGLPTYPTPDFSNSLALVAQNLAVKWIDLSVSVVAAGAVGGEGVDDFSSVKKSDIEGWSTKQITIFLDLLITHSEKDDEKSYTDIYSHDFIRKLDETYGFTASHNSEIMLRWHTICLHSECEWILDRVVQFITEQGRMKFVRPLYRTLRATSIGRELAVETFEKSKD
eukprot:gene34235-42217_t